MKMISHLNSVIFAVFLLFLTADGRKILAHVEGVNVITSSSSATLSVDTTSSCTTHSNDVKGLIVLIDEFPQLSEVVKFPSINKDPCSPHKLTWISCSNDPIRRVTALYLGSRNLHGPIPDFSSMDALQTIDLHGNYLSGPIPGFFTSFPKLKHLNLAKNSVSNTKKPRFRSLAVAAPRPPSYYCPRYPCPAPPAPVYLFYRPPPPPASSYGFPQPDHPSRFGKGKRSKLPKILGITIPPSLLTAIGGVCCCARNRKRKKEEAEAKARAKDAAAAAPAAADHLAAPAGHPPYSFHRL